MPWRPSLIVFLVCTTILAACGIGDTGSAPTAVPATPETVATSAPEPTRAVEPTSAPGATTDWKQAVVRIVAAGSVTEPSVGTQLNIGGGSGFIIDASGLVVTNNHVVTGTGLQKVYVEGHDEPYNAHVLGASECSDLAVIQIDGDGETFPTLQWYEGDIATGLKVSQGVVVNGGEGIPARGGDIFEGTWQ